MSITAGKVYISSSTNTNWIPTGTMTTAPNFTFQTADLFGPEPEMIEDTRDETPAKRRVGEGLPDFLKKHLFVRTDLTHDYEDDKDNLHPTINDEDIIKRQPWDEVGLKKANLITSVVKATKGKPVETHRLMLDLDFDAALVSSSTPGHHHLYLDKELTKEQMDKVVAVLNEVGILQDGVKNGYNRRGALSLRLPWVDKNSYEDSHFDYEEYEKREKLRKQALALQQQAKDTLAQLAQLSK